MADREVNLNLRGDASYARYLDRLRKAERARGVRLPDGDAALAEYALVLLGLRNELVAPPRSARRPGRPRAVAK